MQFIFRALKHRFREARNEFTKFPLTCTALAGSSVWSTGVKQAAGTHARALNCCSGGRRAAAAFVASLISIWRMQVYCVLCVSAERSSGGCARAPLPPLDLSWGKCDQTWMQSAGARGQRQVWARRNRINYWCMLRCGFAVSWRRRLRPPTTTRLSAEPFAGWWKIKESPAMHSLSAQALCSPYSRCHLPFLHAWRRLCKIAARQESRLSWVQLSFAYKSAKRGIQSAKLVMDFYWLHVCVCIESVDCGFVSYFDAFFVDVLNYISGGVCSKCLEIHSAGFGIWALFKKKCKHLMPTCVN